MWKIETSYWFFATGKSIALCERSTFICFVNESSTNHPSLHSSVVPHLALTLPEGKVCRWSWCSSSWSRHHPPYWPGWRLWDSKPSGIARTCRARIGYISWSVLKTKTKQARVKTKKGKMIYLNSMGLPFRWSAVSLISWTAASCSAASKSSVGLFTNSFMDSGPFDLSSGVGVRTRLCTRTNWPNVICICAGFRPDSKLVPRLEMHKRESMGFLGF